MTSLAQVGRLQRVEYTQKDVLSEVPRHWTDEEAQECLLPHISKFEEM